MIREIADELGAIWAFWTGLMFLVNFLLWILPLIENYSPSVENAIDFQLQLIAYLIADAAVSAVVGAIISMITKPFIRFFKELGLW